MKRRRKMETSPAISPDRARTVLIGVQVPVNFHREVKDAATRENLPIGSFLRKLITDHLDAQAGQGK